MQREKTLSRLVRLRQMEEEVSRIELESAVVDRNRVLRSWHAAGAAALEGKGEFARGIVSGDGVARQGALVAVEQSHCRQKSLDTELESCEQRMEGLQAEFFSRRTSTLQAETLLEQARQERGAEEARRLQQILDDWYANRRRTGAARSAVEPGTGVEPVPTS